MIVQDTLSTPESELLVVQEAARLITKSPDVSHCIQGILGLMSQLLGLNRGRLLLPDSISGKLSIQYSYGLTDEERKRGQYAFGEGVTGRIFETGHVAVIQDIDNEPTYLGRAVDRERLPSEAVAYIAVPILFDDTPIGVLAVHRLRKRERPFQRDLTLLQTLAAFIAQILRIEQIVSDRTASLRDENNALRKKLDSPGISYGILGSSPALHRAINQALQVARTNTTVLLLGESGTGKERFARMQHLASERSEGPFVSVNCAAIPASLIESELFGHEKGAFTGATSVKKGRVELASGGTLFLDEIGDLDLELQAKLLRVLEEKSIQRVGSTRDVQVDVRIVAATHKNLREMVVDGRFRLDLYYRLNVFPIQLPPLRARHGDLPILAQHFLQRSNEEFNLDRSFARGSLALLDGYNWPGNIRQLENLIKRAVLLAEEESISYKLIERILADEEGIAPSQISRGEEAFRNQQTPASESPNSPSENIRPYAKVDSREENDIRAALNTNLGNKTRAAISLGLTPRQFRYRLKKLGIS